MTGLSEAKVSLCRAFDDEDEGYVKELVENAFRGFLNGKYWDWKYKLNPNFDSSLVAVAEKNGKIVGCNHWLIRELKIFGSTEVKAVLGADIAVSPDYRGRGIGKSLLLFLRSSQAIRDKGVILSYMFADPNLSKRFYKPVAGYIPAPTTTVSYFKLLSWSKLKNNIKAVNGKLKREKERLEKISKLDLKIRFQLSGAPKLLLKLSKKGVEAGERDLKNADVIVTGDLSTLTVLKEKKNRIRNLSKALLTRKLKIKGSLFNLFRFYRSFWLIEEVFSEKIS